MAGNPRDGRISESVSPKGQVGMRRIARLSLFLIGLKQSPQAFVKRSQVELVGFPKFRRKLIRPCLKDAK